MSYRIILSPLASADLKRLDKAIAQRVYIKMHWLSENFERIKPEALTGRYAGLFKFKIGSYRLVYRINHADKTLYVTFIDHRKDAYREH